MEDHSICALGRSMNVLEDCSILTLLKFVHVVSITEPYQKTDIEEKMEYYFSFGKDMDSMKCELKGIV